MRTHGGYTGHETRTDVMVIICKKWISTKKSSIRIVEHVHCLHHVVASSICASSVKMRDRNIN